MHLHDREVEAGTQNLAAGVWKPTTEQIEQGRSVSFWKSLQSVLRDIVLFCMA